MHSHTALVVTPMCVAPRLCSVATVRIGLAVQALLACLYCAPRALPLLFLGYSLGGACYAVGRVLTVRGHAWPGHMVHCGVHVFANLGNLLILPYVIV